MPQSLSAHPMAAHPGCRRVHRTGLVWMPATLAPWMTRPPGRLVARRRPDAMPSSTRRTAAQPGSQTLPAGVTAASNIKGTEPQRGVGHLHVRCHPSHDRRRRASWAIIPNATTPITQVNRRTPSPSRSGSPNSDSHGAIVCSEDAGSTRADAHLDKVNQTPPLTVRWPAHRIVWASRGRSR